MTNVGGLIPFFAPFAGYIVNNYGTAFSILSSTQLRINATGRYTVSISFQPTTNQSNLLLNRNGNLYLYSGQGGALQTPSINAVL